MKPNTKTLETVELPADAVKLCMAPIGRGIRVVAFLVADGGIRYVLEQHTPDARAAEAESRVFVAREDAMALIKIAEVGATR